MALGAVLLQRVAALKFRDGGGIDVLQRLDDPLARIGEVDVVEEAGAGRLLARAAGGLALADDAQQADLVVGSVAARQVEADAAGGGVGIGQHLRL